SFCALTGICFFVSSRRNTAIVRLYIASTAIRITLIHMEFFVTQSMTAMGKCFKFFVLSVLFLAYLAGCDGREPFQSGSEPEETPANVDQVVNVYSSRHYDSDDAIYNRFTEETGIKVNLIESNADDLIARIQREGDLSPADVLIVVDAARLYRAETKGLFQPTDSSILNEQIPQSLRHPEGLWFGLTQRVRVLVASNERVPESLVRTYEDLAQPSWEGRVLVRSSGNVYNQSLVASMIATLGEEEAEMWCAGLSKNFARKPQGGDRDQIRAVAAGVGDIAIVNHYYFARMLASEGPDKEAASSVRLIFPNQEDRGSHANVCGGGVIAGAPNERHHEGTGTERSG
ncbi:MAG: extracellular solute-binding protein, partial [Planctomycetota bacterium]